MDITALKKYQPHLIVLFLFFFMAIAFVLRILPAFVTRDLSFFPVYDTDTWYNLRQIEVMVHNFPQYNWFDPMTAYPTGKMIDWGPGLPFIAAVFCIITGAQSQAGIVAAAGFVPPLMAALMVPVMYYLGLKIGDWKTGITAAGLISVTSFLYFTFSSYGMVDHHMAEVLFSTLVILVYLSAVSYAKEHPITRTSLNTATFFCGLALLAGIFYFVALITSTTVLLVLLVIAIYTFIQNVADFLHSRDPEYLCTLNLAMLGAAIALLVLFGFVREGLSFMSYSPGLVLVHGAVAAESVALYALSKVLRGRRTPYFLVLAGLIFGGAILTLAVPALGMVSSQAINLVFGYSAFSVGVQETLPWSFSGAFDAINVGIFLVAGGFLVLGYNLVKKQDRELIFIAVWSLVMLLLTIQFQRFQYYFAVNIALLSALCITEPFRWNLAAVLRRMPSGLNRQSATGEGDPSGERLSVPEKPAKKKKTAPAPIHSAGMTDLLKMICLATVCIVTVTHIGLSLSQDYAYAINANDRVIPSDWLESLEWLRTGTPDPGIGYFDQYVKTGYTAPSDSYGILAVWDAGHWITFFSHRMPVTNPFQDNLGGTSGTAAFFLSDNETQASSILKKYRGRYVITDSSMAVDRFTNLVPWMSGSVDISRYIKWFLVTDPKDTSHLEKTHLFDDGYYQTLVVRLYTFDGSLTMPDSAKYVQYTIRKPTALETADATGFSRVISNRQTIDVTRFNATDTPIMEEGPELLPTMYANFYSDMPDEPIKTVPALTHYRLVHESPEDASVIPFPESEPFILPGIKMVKIFEYVKGAHIAGEGIIEIPLVTNTGRTFVYRQQSSRGEFIVPYSTQGNTYDVRATGPYHIIGTSRTFEVPEEAVMEGRAVKT
ncbi:MAG: oligosaccharyl transferase, archaeosortase A system-associated [Methanoregula sp.]|jgi:dolichyl-diphosphooligosaccharide--protein glycosyltransferase